MISQRSTIIGKLRINPTVTNRTSKRIVIGAAARIVAITWITLSGAIAEAAWVIEPAANVETRYDDNVRGSASNEESGTINTLGGQARLRNVSDASEVSIMAGGSLSKYSGVDSFENDDRESLFFEGRAQRRLERSQFQLRASLRRQDLLRYFAVLEPVDAAGELGEQELEDMPIIEEPGVEDDLITGVDVDLGSVEELVQRDSIRIEPSYSYQLSARNNITLRYGFSDVSYDDPAQSNSLEDHRSHRASVELARLISPLSSIAVQVEASRFEPEFNLDSDSVSIVATWRQRLSERTTLSLGAGGRTTDNDVYEDSGALFNARIDRSTDTGSLYVTAERNLSPSGYGDQVESDRITFGFRDKLSDRVSWRLNTRAFRTETISQFQQDNSRDYLQVEPSVQWAFAKEWQVRLSYRYTWVDRETDVDTVTSNSVGISLEYVPPRRL